MILKLSLVLSFVLLLALLLVLLLVLWQTCALPFLGSDQGIPRIYLQGLNISIGMNTVQYHRLKHFCLAGIDKWSFSHSNIHSFDWVSSWSALSQWVHKCSYRDYLYRKLIPLVSFYLQYNKISLKWCSQQPARIKELDMYFFAYRILNVTQQMLSLQI